MPSRYYNVCGFFLLELVTEVKYLQHFKANIISDGAVLHVVLLIGMHVQQVHDFVGLHSAFQEEDEESARPAHLQVVG